MAILQLVSSRQRDLGSLVVRRVLPAARQQMVGPFVFFDHMGPKQFPPGHGIDVRPHPHIALATVTYLFAGVLELEHRDSLGMCARSAPEMCETEFIPLPSEGEHQRSLYER